MIVQHHKVFAKRTDNIAALIEAFKARVLADGGVFTAESCLVSTLNSLNV